MENIKPLKFLQIYLNKRKSNKSSKNKRKEKKLVLLEDYKMILSTVKMLMKLVWIMN
jgi:hypothetical protein